jgi:hypothetical protein
LPVPFLVTRAGLALASVVVTAFGTVVVAFGWVVVVWADACIGTLMASSPRAVATAKNFRIILLRERVC